MNNNQRILNRARHMVKGLIVRWSDTEPLRETPNIQQVEVSHRNPVLRLAARKIFHDVGEWILHRQAFRWLVNIAVIFKYPNGVEQRETRELEAMATIDALNEHCIEQIRDAIRHGAEEHYRHTEFTIECLGSN